MARQRRVGVFRSPLVAAVALGITFTQLSAVAEANGAITQDAKYLVDSTQMDLVDVVTAPLHIADPDSVLRSPRFYLVLTGVGAIWGGSYALDQTIRSHLRDMSSSDASLLEDTSYGSVSAATASLYAYGLWSGDSRAREHAITAGEAAGVATLLNVGIKAAFGRLRPRQDGHDHTAFFRGGRSFFSGDVTPMFALAAGVSEYFENRWYVAAPIYSLALVDGFGRIGHDAHWLSDVVGAAFLGAGTTELLLYLHKNHAQQPDRWRFFPDSLSPMTPAASHSEVPTGLAATWNW
jgi:membrane-associated phospholipid phosphatase